jgi:hypothetical protein
MTNLAAANRRTPKATIGPVAPCRASQREKAKALYYVTVERRNVPAAVTALWAKSSP